MLYKGGRLKVMLAGKDSAFSVKSESIHLDACSHVFSEQFSEKFNLGRESLKRFEKRRHLSLLDILKSHLCLREHATHTHTITKEYVD